MLFSQYIYTSWNNGDSPNKGFMIYGKSNGIGEDEAKFILETMRYKPHRSLPDMPTSSEIEKDFPKNFAVFPIDQLKTCIAQATYVGRDYVKEENPRYGNYIIHALVGSGFESACLWNLTHLSVFKTGLTLAEQDAPAGPHLLDAIEIPKEDLCVRRATQIPDDDAFWLMLQAVLLSFGQDKNVYVTIDQTKVEAWVEALLYLLPASVTAKLTLATYLLNKNPQFKLNFIHRESPTFRPNEECMHSNSYVIHSFLPQYNSQIPLGSYVTALRNLRNEVGEYAVIQYREEIEKRLQQFSLGEDVDLAANIEAFYNLDPQFCRDSRNIYHIVDKYGFNDPYLRRQISQLAFRAFEQYRDEYGDLECSICRMIYHDLSEFEQRIIKEKISLHLLEASADADELLGAYKSYVQIFGADTKTVMESQLWKMIGYPKAQRIAESYCRQNIKTVTLPELIDLYCRDLKTRLCQALETDDWQQLETVMQECLVGCEMGWYPLKELIADLNFSNCWLYPSVAFHLLDIVSDRLYIYIQFIDCILSYNDGTSLALIEKLENSIQRAVCMKGERIEGLIGDLHPEYIKARNRIKAMETAATSRQRLCQYYHEFVANENSDDTDKLEREFHRLLQSFFQNTPPEKRSKEAIAIYEFLSSLEDARAYSSNLVMILYRNAFDTVTLEQLIQWRVSAKTVDELNVQAKRFRIPNAPVALIYQDYCFFKQCYGLMKNRVGDLQAILWETEFYYRYPGCPANLRHDFMMRTFPLIMQCTVGTVSPLDYPAILTHLLACFASDRTFAGLYLDYLQSLASFGPAHLILLTYCAESEDQFADFLNNSVLLPYLKKLGKGDREVLFAYWLKHSEDRSAAEEYIRNYQENHRSLWDKLFSKKKADQPQEDDTDTLN